VLCIGLLYVALRAAGLAAAVGPVVDSVLVALVALAVFALGCGPLRRGRPGADADGGALAHAAFAGLLGVAGVAIGRPLVLFSIFGGGLLPVVGILAVAVVGEAVALAIVLDEARGPGRGGRDGSRRRGIVVGVVGCVGMFTTIVIMLASGLLIPDQPLASVLMMLVAALPFAVTVALQWIGADPHEGVAGSVS